jgi:hypothetical protein
MGKDDEIEIAAPCSVREVGISFEVGRSMFI